MDHDDCARKLNVDCGPTNEVHALSCTSCTRLCNGINETIDQKCHFVGCHRCADFARVNDEIASTYKRLFDLIAERQKFVTKTGHETLIHRMPVEVLSSIFVSVSEQALDFEPEELDLDNIVPERPFRQPSTSPALLVGAVCRRWREVSLATPQLWTDLIISLTKPLEGQYNMVKEWARRSGALSLDIVIFPQYTDLSDENCPEFSILLSTLRLLAPRWNNLALSVPITICHRLLNNLEDTPPINSLSLFNSYMDIEDIKLPHPFRPRRLICNWDVLYKEAFPFEWHRLEFLKLDTASADEIFDIIQHAENLKHCFVKSQLRLDGSDPTMINHITHRSLVSFNPHVGGLIQHLTLPALRHLDYGPIFENSLDSLAAFLDRSRAPLNVFTFRCFLSPDDPFPRLERLCGVTSLYFELYAMREPHSDKIENFLALLCPSPPRSLSRLKKITFGLPDLSTSSWSILGRLFHEDADPSDNGTLVLPNDYTPKRTVRSGDPIPFSDDITAAMKTRPILRLLQVKQSGVDIHIDSGLNGFDSLIL